MVAAQAACSAPQGRVAASPNTHEHTDTVHAAGGRTLLGSWGFRAWDPLNPPLPTAAVDLSDFQNHWTQDPICYTMHNGATGSKNVFWGELRSSLSCLRDPGLCAQSLSAYPPHGAALDASSQTVITIYTSITSSKLHFTSQSTKYLTRWC